jgi:hypothetical protein
VGPVQNLPVSQWTNAKPLPQLHVPALAQTALVGQEQEDSPALQSLTGQLTLSSVHGTGRVSSQSCVTETEEQPVPLLVPVVPVVRPVVPVKPVLPEVPM